jgi:hypothetical protein
MTITDFLDHIKHPEMIEVEDIAIVRDLADRFPYCTSAQILLAYRLFTNNDLDFPAQLKKVAAYAPSRKKLKELLENLQLLREKHIQSEEVTVTADQITDESEVPAEMVEEPIIEMPVENFEYTTIPDREGPHSEQPSPEKAREEELLAIVRKRLAEIKLEREKEAATNEPATLSESPDTMKRGLSRSELVDKFLHDKPRLSPPKTTFFSPSERALKSNQDDEEIVTETLARLYYKQGNIGKAVKIYEKLILLFPEKSSYFAAQIEKMTSHPSASQEEGKD